MEQTGGYDLSFIDDVPDHFICVICQMVLKEPLLLVDCGHTFCHSCFNQLKGNAERSNEELLCPTDRTKVDVNKVFENKALTRLVLDLKVKCSHNMEGCQWIGEVRDLEKHMKTDCNINENEAFLLQMKKRMDAMEKLLKEKDRKLESYERRIDENTRRMQVCENLLKEKDRKLESYERRFKENERRMRVCEEQLKELGENLISQSNTSGQMNLSITSTSITKEPSNGYLPPVSVISRIPPGTASQFIPKTEDSRHINDPEIIKAREEWNRKKCDTEKYNYIKDLCVRKEEQLIIKWLETNDELWEFRDQFETILHVAARGGCTEVINFIRKSERIDMNIQNDYGKTPLHLAVWYDHYNTFQIMLQNKCKVNVKDTTGRTALDYAQSKKNNEMKRMLQQAGGKRGRDC